MYVPPWQTGQISYMKETKTKTKTKINQTKNKPKPNKPLNTAAAIQK